MANTTTTTHRRRVTLADMLAGGFSFQNAKKVLYVLRWVEIVLALTYLVLLAYSGVNHGWWNNLGQPLGFGITASLLTIAISIPTLFGYASVHATASLRHHFNHYLRVVCEWVLLALWSAAFVTMLLGKGKNYKLSFERPPYAAWDIAVVIAVFEIIFFIYSATLVMQEKYIEDPEPFSATAELNRVRRRPRGHSAAV